MARRARRGRHEGGCHQRSSDGLWVASKSCGTDPQTGKRLRMTAYGVTKSEALERLDELKRQATSGTLPDARQLTVGQLLTKWLDNLRGRGSARTYEERERVVRLHLAPRIGAARLDRLHALHVEGLFSGMRNDGVKPWAVRSAALHLTTALNFAVRLKLIPHSPVAGVAKPAAARRPMVVLDPGQARAVREAAAGDPAGPLVVTALATGCRLGELLALAWDDIDLRAGTLHVRRALSRTTAGYVVKEPKTASGRRVVALPAFAVAALTAHKAAALKAGRLAAPVFAGRDGGFRPAPVARKGFARVVGRANARLSAGGAVKPVPRGVRFGSLRHTQASILLSTGHSLRAVSQRLGHRDPAMTLRIYSHVLPTDDAALAAGLTAAIG